MSKNSKYLVILLAISTALLMVFFNSTSSLKRYGFRAKIFDPWMLMTTESDGAVIPGYGNTPLGYFYSPATVKVDGVYHTFGCSGDFGTQDKRQQNGWDIIRYATSKDAKTWSYPKIVLWTTSLKDEVSACDPSVVFANGYWYLFYSGYNYNVGTVNFVSRSKSIEGPYAKLTTENTWVVNATNPRPIVLPRRPAYDNTGFYGAGQPTVVYRNGKFHQWYHDDTTKHPEKAHNAYYVTSSDAVNWSSPVALTSNKAQIGPASFDVKFDSKLQKYIMHYIVNENRSNNYLVRRYSINGVDWTAEETVIPANDFPKYSHNVALSGDPSGNVIQNESSLVLYATSNYSDFTSYFDVIDVKHTGITATWDTVAHFIENSTAQRKSTVMGLITNVEFENKIIKIQGWACASGVSNSIDVHLYLGGPAGSGKFITNQKANFPVKASVSQVCASGIRAHGFDFRLKLEDISQFVGQSIYVHGISPEKDENYLMNQSGTYAIQNGEVKGHIDSLKYDAKGNSIISGWACARGVEKAIDVHVYAMDEKTEMKGVAVARADVKSEAAVSKECGTNKTAHRFKLAIEANTSKNLKGQTLQIFGISPHGAQNRLLNKSGKIKW